MYRYTQDGVDLGELRVRLRKLTDEELIRLDKAGRYMCSPHANFGEQPRECFVIQLREVIAEWKSRQPRNERIGRIDLSVDKQ